MWSSFRDNLTDAYGAIDAAEAARTAATSLIRFLEPVRALLEDFNQQAKYTLVYIAICKVIWDTWASSAADNGTTSQISKAEDTDATPREDNIVNDSQNHKKRRPTWKQLVEHTAFFITLYTWPTVHWESCRFMKEYCAIPVLSWLGFRPGGQIMSTPQWLLSPAIVILIPWITLTGYLDNTSRPCRQGNRGGVYHWIGNHHLRETEHDALTCDLAKKRGSRIRRPRRGERVAFRQDDRLPIVVAFSDTSGPLGI